MQNHPSNRGRLVTLDGTQPEDVKSLVDIFDPPGLDEQQRDMYPGSWTLNMRSVATVSGLANEVNAAVAVISWGAGGMAMEAEVSLFPDAVVVLPATRCSVKVQWDRLPAGYNRPASVEIRGHIQRTFGGQRRARRIVWLPLTLVTGGPGTFPVPAFARSLRPYADNLTHPAFSSDMQWSFLPGGWVQSGLQLGSLAARGLEYELGGGVSEINGNAGIANWGAVFPAPFTVPSVWGLDWGIEI